MERTSIKLYAANGTEIPVLGAVKLTFEIESHPITADLLVSEAIEELILGIDWLSDHGCMWDFGSAKLTFHGYSIPLHKRSGRICVRRIYAAEDCVLPPGTQTNIPFKATYSNLHAPRTDWVLESRALGEGVVAARTLVNDSPQAAVRVINYSDVPCKFKRNTFLGIAEPAEAFDVTESPAVGSSPGSEAQSAAAGRPAESAVGFVRSAGASVGCNLSAATDSQASGNTIGSFTYDFAHVQCIVDCLPPDLSVGERARAVQFIRGYADIFSKSEFDIGRTDVMEHSIDIGQNRPFKQQLRRHPTAHLDVIDAHVGEMLRHDVIEPAASPFCSNVVLVRKHDGSLRFCVDYRQLNELTYKDSYPLPRIDACLDALGGAEYYATLDLRAGYWQTVIRESDRDKTAFVTRRGQWRFKVLSFGLANAPSSFQRLMDLILSGLTYVSCLVYLDDVIVFSQNFEQMVERLADVFGRLRSANLKLKPSKCKLFQRRVVFLGHVVSKQGIECDPEKVKAVETWPRPRSITDARAFCGLASYYRSFIRGFSELARPLHELTRKGARFEWNERHETAFNELKRRLTTAPVLAAPRDDGRFVLDTDASDFAVGAILHQEQNGELKVIAYASRSLSAPERNYCTTRKELLAVIFGLKKFRQHLLAREIVIRTDHAALSELKRKPEPVGQQGRYLDFLAEFNFVIEHRSGTASQNSDGLSRIPCERDTNVQCKQCHKTAVNECANGHAVCRDGSYVVEADALPEGGAAGTMPVVVADRQSAVGADNRSVAADIPEASVRVIDRRAKSAVVSPEKPAGVQGAIATPGLEAGFMDETNLFSHEQISKAQNEDENIKQILKWRQDSDDPPSWGEVQRFSNETRTYWAQWQSLEVIDGVLNRRFAAADGRTKYMQIILPHSLREKFVDLCHSAGGHFGFHKTCAQIARRAYFSGWKAVVGRRLQACDACQRFRRGGPPKQARLQPIHASFPMECLHVDLVGPLPDGQGYTEGHPGTRYRWILTCIDAYTRYLIMVPLRDKTIATVTDALIREVFCKVGLSYRLCSDQGLEFQGHFLRTLGHPTGPQFPISPFLQWSN